jgi:hypothetical protein
VQLSQPPSIFLKKISEFFPDALDKSPVFSLIDYAKNISPNTKGEKMEEKKRIKYIVDTSAIIADPDVIYRLKDNIVHIPMVVIRELDGLKNSDEDLVARNARHFTRTLDRFSSYADLMEGVKLSSGGILKLYRDYIKINELDSDADNKVIGAGMHIRKRHSGRVCVLSTDGNMRVVARSHGLAAELAPFYIGENEPKTVSKTDAIENDPAPVLKTTEDDNVRKICRKETGLNRIVRIVKHIWKTYYAWEPKPFVSSKEEIRKP